MCEQEQCDGSVGFGGSPDESGETTLDAMVIDGTTMNAGAVADLRRVKRASAAARLVLERTSHTLLAGDQATNFAIGMGLEPANLTTAHSHKLWADWRAADCQPNYRENVVPDATTSCGPYKPAQARDGANALALSRAAASRSSRERGVGRGSHDTIAMVIIDGGGNLAAGTSTNGASHKVGDERRACSRFGRVAPADCPAARAAAVR